MQNNPSNQSSWSWSWIVPLILALILLWMLMTGHGPSSACCSPAAPAVATETIIPAEEPTPVTEAFSFSATANDFTDSGDSANIAWIAQSDALKSMLSGDLKAEGDDKNVVLTGTVDSDATKQQKGADVQAFFGSGVVVDNQLVVKAPEPVAAIPPPAAKLYFESGKTSLPSDASTTLSPIIDWLNANSNAKAVLSGYHDSTGDLAFNLELAKNRAKAVRETLKTAGIDEARIEMRKPESVDGGTDLAEARRVEVSVE